VNSISANGADSKPGATNGTQQDGRPPGGGAPILQIRGVSGSPAGDAAGTLDLEVRDGEFFCVVGPPGCGKTALVRVLAGLETPSSGSLLLNGRPAAWGVPALGFTLAENTLFPWLTVRENLETGFAVLPRGERKVPDEIFELFPILKSMLGRRGGDLSGGQQQQLAIGRALVMKPRLLVLDEPTEGIQPSIIKDIGRVIDLLRGRGEMAILLVEQYFDFARDLGQRLIVMDRGDIVVNSSRADLDEDDVRRRLSV